MGSCLFDMVVRISREEEAGTRSSMRCRKSEMVEDGSVGRESVDGRPKPPKLVIRTFRLQVAMTAAQDGDSFK